MSPPPLGTVLFRWEHTDPDLPAASEEAIAYALGGGLLSAQGDFRNRLMRALAARTLIACADLSSEPPPVGGVKLTLPDLSLVGWPSPEHLEVAQALLGTYGVLCFGRTPKHTSVFTTAGGPPSFDAPSENSAAPWVWVAVAAIGAAAYVFTSVYLAEETAYTSDRAHKREDVGAKLMEAHAALLKLAEQHAELERLAQKTLPMNEAEKAALALLKKEQAALLQVYQSEKPPERPSGFWGSLGKGLPFVLLGAGALFVLSRKG